MPPAPTPINPVGQNLSFALISDGGNQKDVQVFVSQGGIRKRSMILKPGIADSKIKISCVEIQGTICKYVNLNETSFSLKARSGDVIVPYEISLPEEVANSNFIFLINATDENLNSDSVRVSVSVSDLGLIFEYFGKLIQFKIYNNVITGYQNIEIQYFLLCYLRRWFGDRSRFGFESWKNRITGKLWELACYLAFLWWWLFAWI